MSTGPSPWSPWLRNWCPAKVQVPLSWMMVAGRALAGLQRRHRHEGLVGRARRIGAAQGPVEQRLVDRLVERLPVLVIDAVDEQVGVEGGLAHQGQHLAGLGVERDQCAAAVAVQVLDQLLQPDVDRQHHGVAGRRRIARELAHRPPAGRGLDRVDTGDAMQLALEALLHARACRCIRCRGSWPRLRSRRGGPSRSC